jgi:hypothetical protein
MLFHAAAEGKKEAVDSEHGTQQLVWHLNVSSSGQLIGAAAVTAAAVTYSAVWGYA